MSPSIRGLALAGLMFLGSLSPGPAHAAPIISEFMASNGTTLVDGDGDSSDWVEIHNPGPTTLDLGGHHLTDRPDWLTRWTFPAGTWVGPNGYLVVFASGKFPSGPPGERHTNFRLDADGEFLALVAPDGTNILSVFGTTEVPFPEQREDVSFGRGVARTEAVLVGWSHPVRYRVPLSSGELTESWAEPHFPDAAWSPGSTGLGFDRGISAAAGAAPAAYWPLGEGTGLTAFDRSGQEHHGTLQNGPTWVVGAPSVLSATRSLRFDGIDDYVQTPFDGVLGSRSRTVSFWIRSSDTSTHGIIAWGDSTGQGTKWNLRLNSDAPNGVIGAVRTEVEGGYAIGSRNIADGQWHHVASVFHNDGTPDISDLALYIDGARDSLSGVNPEPVSTALTSDQVMLGRRRQGTALHHVAATLHDVAIFDTALTAVQVEALASGEAGPAELQSYRPWIETDLETEMAGRNASVFIRCPFVLEDGDSMEELTLRIQYDDGFVAYLNGVEVASRNVPLQRAWNSAALVGRADSSALVAERIDLSTRSSLLRAGTNVLALHAMNETAAEEDFLIRAELRGASLTPLEDGYFAEPTPGAPNGTPFLGFVQDTTFDPDRGFYHEPFQVILRSGTAEARIHYTTDGSKPTSTHGRRYTGPVLVTNTTTLRAVAWKEGYLPTDVDTHTYIFPGQVVRQPALPAGVPSTWSNLDGFRPADYEMDPEIVGQRYSPEEVKVALRTLPTLSLVTEAGHLFDPQTGIYVNSTRKGDAWEREVSAEFFDFPHGLSVQVNAGLRMNGIASRNPDRRKHNMRLTFRRDYGVARLEFPLFEGHPVRRLNSLILRGGNGDSWINPFVDERAQYIRDQWHRDIQKLQGGPHQPQLYAHLYLNGLYWGLYHVFERIDEQFAAEHFGGREEDYDVIKHNVNSSATGPPEVTAGSLDAWNAALNLANAGLSAPAAYASIQSYIDIDLHIDYMLVNFYSGNDDWDHNNWRALRNRARPDTFKYFCWDSERTDINALGASPGSYGPVDRDVTGTDRPFAPTHIHQRLAANADYRRRFGDRAHELLFNQGPLSPTGAAAAWNERADQIRVALRAESARWGDVHSSSPHHPQGTWAATLAHMNAAFFPFRSDIVKGQLRNRGLYPPVEAPTFTPWGGPVPRGWVLPLSHDNSSGTIYYTTDGTDPRDSSGAPAAGAFAYTKPLILEEPVFLRARVRQGTLWSALARADFYPAQDLAALQVTEIMYHPVAHAGWPAEELEFLEFKNIGDDPLNLSGMAFSSGIRFAFVQGTVLDPGAFLVLGRNPDALARRYPGLVVDGIYTGYLDNGGEGLELSQGHGHVVWTTAFNDGGRWPAVADGLGFSIVPRTLPPVHPTDRPDHWRASRSPGGSPGGDDPPPDHPEVILNEVLIRPAAPAGGFVELYNPTGRDADLGGWFLSNDRAEPFKYRLPEGTLVPAGGYLVLEEADYQSGGVSLNPAGGELYLFSADGANTLTGHSDGFRFGAVAQGVSLGRHLPSTGLEHYPAQRQITPGKANAGPQVGPVVLRQIMFHPLQDSSGLGERRREFLELQNVSERAVDLFGETGPWRLRDAVTFAFASGTRLEPGARLLVVGFDPADVAARTSFEAAYGSLRGVPLQGPFLGQLDNGDDRVELVRPGSPDDLGEVSEILVERVHYESRSPWPEGAGGTGAGLQRDPLLGYGNDPAHWKTSADITILSPPQGGDVAPGGSLTLSVSAIGTGTLQYQWQHDGVDIPGATSDTLVLVDLQEADQGFYAVRVRDDSGSLTTLPVFVGVLVRPYFSQQPVDRTVVEGGVITLQVRSGGHLPMGYRWRLNGVTLTNEVSHDHRSSLVLEDVQASEAGFYDVILTNAAFYLPGVLSVPGTLTVLADGDEDGLPDEVESFHGLDPTDGRDADRDLDHDGSSNLDEYQAGTDLADPESVLRLEIVAHDAARRSFRFEQRAHRAYRILRAASPDATSWSVVLEVEAQPTDRIAEVVDDTPASASGFYRLVIP